MALICTLMVTGITVTHACYGPYRVDIIPWKSAMWVNKDDVPDVMDPNALVGDWIVLDDKCYELQSFVDQKENPAYIVWKTSPMFTTTDGFGRHFTVSFELENTCSKDYPTKSGEVAPQTPSWIKTATGKDVGFFGVGRSQCGRVRGSMLPLCTHQGPWCEQQASGGGDGGRFRSRVRSRVRSGGDRVEMNNYGHHMI